MTINFDPLPRSSQAFTLAELLISTVIILLTSLAILFSYTQCLELNVINKNTSIAVGAGRNMMETIRSTTFDQIYNTYNNKTFPLPNLEGIGAISVDTKNPSLLSVSVKVFWKTKKRVMGEDTNLNGIMDFDEDVNNNGTLDSPVSLFTHIAKR